MKTTSLVTFLSACLDLIYPPECLLCHDKLDSSSKVLCTVCRNSICFNTPPFCKKCSRHLSKPDRKNLCPQCRKRMPDFNRAWGALFYNDAMRHLLHSFKYQKKTVLRHFFAELTISFIERYQIPIKTFDGLVAMPIHPAKHREREFNQTELLCQLISKEFQIPIYTNNLIRSKNTAPQAFLEEKERWTNVKDAFRIRKPLELKNKSVLIVDDLLTTGATACEAAKICKQAGAKKVNILTLAIGQ